MLFLRFKYILNNKYIYIYFYTDLGILFYFFFFKKKISFFFLILKFKEVLMEIGLIKNK
jgi:hypothetical protein